MTDEDPEGPSDSPDRGLPELRAEPVRRVLLVGFMGSGKSSVGKQVAARLGWPFVDFDEAIEETAGASIEDIFEQWGEEGFRRLEAEVGQRLLRRAPVVLASGGGWAARPNRLDEIPPGTLAVWLRVSPEVALERVGADGRVRPLLGVPDPGARAAELLALREPFYARAELTLDTDAATVASLADRIAAAVKTSEVREGPGSIDQVGRSP